MKEFENHQLDQIIAQMKIISEAEASGIKCTIFRQQLDCMIHQKPIRINFDYEPRNQTNDNNGL